MTVKINPSSHSLCWFSALATSFETCSLFFQEQPVLRCLIDDGFIVEDDMLYQAVFERGKGKQSLAYK